MTLTIRLLVAAAALGALSFVFSPTASAQQTATVAVGDTWFCDASFQGGVCETTISAGDTVLWDFSGAFIPHSTTECGASCDAPGAPTWDSGIVSDRSSFSYTFTQPGTYLYYCTVHPDLQRGRIIVQDQAPRPQEPADQPGEPAAPNAPADGVAPPQAGLPPMGQGPEDASASSWWMIAAASVALAAGAFMALRRGSRSA